MNQQNTFHPSYLAVAAIALAIAVVTATGITCIYHHHFAQQIKVVDLKGYIQSQKERLATGEIDEDGWRADLDAFEKRLQNEPANHVVILKEMVLKNGEELHFQ